MTHLAIRCVGFLCKNQNFLIEKLISTSLFFSTDCSNLIFCTLFNISFTQAWGRIWSILTFQAAVWLRTTRWYSHLNILLVTGQIITWYPRDNFTRTLALNGWFCKYGTMGAFYFYDGTVLTFWNIFMTEEAMLSTQSLWWWRHTVNWVGLI